MTENLATRSPAPPVALFGVVFDNVTVDDAIRRIEQMIASGQPHYAVTANVDFLAQAQKDIELHRILLDAHLVLCDGTPLVWASRMLGNRLPERVAGSDIVPALIRVAAKMNYRLFFLGAAPDAAERAMENIRLQFPGLLVDSYSPPFGAVLEMDHEEIKRRIFRLRPDLLFVAFGCPKQEKWIAMHYKSLGVPVSMGIGGTVDFLSGHLKRAPRWMQRTGTEWVFRLAQEPRRLLGRYCADLRVFAAKLLVQWWRLAFHPRIVSARQTTKASVEVRDDFQVVTLPSRWDVKSVRENQFAMEDVSLPSKHCVLDAKQVDAIDSTGIASLVMYQKKLRTANRRLVIVASRPGLKRAFRLMRLENYFAIAADFDAAKELINSCAHQEPVTVTSKPRSQSVSLKWRGEITAVNAEDAWDLTESHVASPDAERLKIDLSDVAFIDSSGVGIMVRAKKLAEGLGRELSFVHLSPAVTNVVRMARLEEFLLSNSQSAPLRAAAYGPARFAAT